MPDPFIIAVTATSIAALETAVNLKVADGYYLARDDFLGATADPEGGDRIYVQQMHFISIDLDEVKYITADTVADLIAQEQALFGVWGHPIDTKLNIYNSLGPPDTIHVSVMFKQL